MKFMFAWVLLLQTVLLEPYANIDNSDGHRGSEQEQPATIGNSGTLTTSHDVPASEHKDAGPHPTNVRERRDEMPPDTKSYTAWVTDGNNISQINATREWLQGVVKDKSKMLELTALP
jgi:hypothetical protein